MASTSSCSSSSFDKSLTLFAASMPAPISSVLAPSISASPQRRILDSLLHIEGVGHNIISYLGNQSLALLRQINKNTRESIPQQTILQNLHREITEMRTIWKGFFPIDASLYQNVNYCGRRLKKMQKEIREDEIVQAALQATGENPQRAAQIIRDADYIDSLLCLPLPEDVQLRIYELSTLEQQVVFVRGWVQEHANEEFFALRELFFQSENIRTIPSDLIEKFPLLKKFCLTDTKIKDISPLTNLSRMRELRLDFVPAFDISPLANLPQLRVLWLTDIPVSDISPLANLPQLQVLNLEENEIQDISPLANLTLLQILNLSYNQIQNISSLKNLTRLRKLSLRNNQIQDFSPLARLTLTASNFREQKIAVNTSKSPSIHSPSLTSSSSSATSTSLSFHSSSSTSSASSNSFLDTGSSSTLSQNSKTMMQDSHILGKRKSPPTDDDPQA